MFLLCKSYYQKPLLISKASVKRNLQQSAYLHKYSATNCDEATIQGTLCILRTKNLIDENLKLLCENNESVDDEISPTAVPGSPNTPTKDTNKISDIVLNDIKNGSRTVAPEKNCSPTPKLTLTLSRGNFPPGQLSGCSPTLKLTLTLTETPRAIVRIPLRKI